MGIQGDDDELLEQMLKEAAEKGAADQKKILEALGEDEKEAPESKNATEEQIATLEGKGPKEEEKGGDIPEVIQEAAEKVGEALKEIGEKTGGLGEISADAMAALKK